MIDEFFNNLNMDLFDNMPIQKECNVPECDKEPEGETWKTRALSEIMPRSYSRDMSQLHMSSKMEELQQVVEVLEEGAYSLKYRELQSVGDKVRRILTFLKVNGRDTP